MVRFFRTVCVIGALSVSAGHAQDVNITQDTAERVMTLNGASVTISRIQNNDNRLSADFAMTSRPCPPFCIVKMSAAPGVETVGELEVIDFLQNVVSPGQGLLLDTRVPSWYAKGAIPGAVNVPFTTLDASNPFRKEILKAFGATEDGDALDFTNAKFLTVYANGPWSDQAETAVQNLRSAGYPAEKIKYYRGGMQLWLLFGLTIGQP